MFSTLARKSNTRCVICFINADEVGVVTGWEANHPKYLKDVKYHPNNGTFSIEVSGVYQVYPFGNHVVVNHNFYNNARPIIMMAY